MNIAELLVGILLVVTLVGLGGYFAVRQFQVRRLLPRERAITPEERAFLIRQTRRRLLCSVLMLLFALLLVGWFFIEPHVRDLKAAENLEPGDTPPVVQLVAYYWILALFLLFGILVLAGLDFFATARYGLHQKKLLEIERHTALEIDAARLRKERNGE